MQTLQTQKFNDADLVQLRRIYDAQRKMRNAMKKAEEYRDKANNIRIKHKLDVLREYGPGKRSTGGHSIDDLTDDRAGKNPKWQAAASNNRWYIDQAIMYAEIARTEAELLNLGLHMD